MKTTWEGLGTFVRFSNAGWSVHSISLAVFVTLITGTRMSNFLYQQPDRWPQIRWPAWHNKIRHVDPEGYDFSLWGRILATVRPLLFPFALPVTRHCKRGWDFCCSLTDHCSTRATSGQIHAQQHFWYSSGLENIFIRRHYRKSTQLWCAFLAFS